MTWVISKTQGKYQPLLNNELLNTGKAIYTIACL